MKYPNETDESLAVRMKSGETDAFAELSGRYMPMIRAKAVGFSGADTDDLCQEGLLGLLSAVRTFSETGAASFKTYAGVCISNRLADAVRSSRRKNSGTVSLDDEEHFDTVSTKAGDPESLLLERENLELAVRRIEQNLTKMERTVFLLFLCGYQYSEIAKRLDISDKAADNAMQRVRKKMKKPF